MTPTVAAEPDGPDDALESLDRALRQAVHGHVDTVMRDTKRDAEARIAEARRAGDALVERAHREGAAVADAMLVRERAALRRENATAVLAAKRSVIHELEQRVRAAVLDLRGASDYAGLLEGLAARAREQLGDDAFVTLDPDGAGGVISELDTRRVDYTLPALAELAVAALDDAVDELLR
jgi:vacuolar-type H+-ATPase subunit E/Vma4